MVEIRRGVHSIDGLGHPLPGVGVVSYLVEETPHDLTLIDSCFLANLQILEKYLHDAGYEISDIKRIIITHLHPDHTQAVKEIKKRSGAQVLSHWQEAPYLRHNPTYNGPPSQETFQNILNHLGVKPEEVMRRFGSFDVEPIDVDLELQDGDLVGRSLKVVHTPGHTQGHISLYSQQQGIIFGADVMFKSIMGNVGLFVPPGTVSIDAREATISARRLGQMKFDTLLLAHQDSPIIEGPKAEVEKALSAQ